MRAANELKSDEKPAITTSMPQDDYDAAKEQLHRVDARIPVDVVEKAIQLFFSTNLLPDYDLSTCYVRELPQHQHACTHHAFTIHQPLLHASSFWQSTQPYMGTLSWNYSQFRSTDPLGG